MATDIRAICRSRTPATRNVNNYILLPYKMATTTLTIELISI